MEKEQLLKKIAHLESVTDQLETELLQLDEMLRAVGFSQGVLSVKNAVHELLEQNLDEEGER